MFSLCIRMKPWVCIFQGNCIQLDDKTRKNEWDHRRSNRDRRPGASISDGTQETSGHKIIVQEQWFAHWFKNVRYSNWESNQQFPRQSNSDTTNWRRTTGNDAVTECFSSILWSQIAVRWILFCFMTFAGHTIRIRKLNASDGSVSF